MSQKKKYISASHDNGWLYVLGYRENPELCKIGITTRAVSDRIREMQTGSAYTIYAYAIFNARRIEDLEMLERQCHNLFQEFRMQGEWFNTKPSIAEQLIRSEYGPRGKSEKLPLFLEWRNDKWVEDASRAVFLKNEIFLDNLLDRNFWQTATSEDIVEILDRDGDLTTRSEDGWTPLHLAIGNNKTPEIISLLLDRGADIEARADGLTPLYLAVKLSQTEIVSLLLDRGADIEARAKDGATLLHFAIANHIIPKIISLLLDRGADIEARADGLTPLYLAVELSQTEIVSLLLDRGADTEARMSENRATLLHFAVANTMIPKIISLLLGRGADLEARMEENGWTPLHVAAVYSETSEIIALLLDRGADIKARAKDGATPLHLAATNSKTPEIVSLLIDRGADINKKAGSKGNGFTPLHLAVELNETDMVSLLLGLGANIEVRSNDGWTPLHLAVKQSEKLTMVLLLLDRGADADAQNSEGKTPFDYAKENEHWHKKEITQEEKEKIKKEITYINKEIKKHSRSFVLQERIGQRTIKEHEKNFNDLKKSSSLFQRRAKLRIMKKEYKKAVVDLSKAKQQKEITRKIKKTIDRRKQKSDKEVKQDTKKENNISWYKRLGIFR